MKKKQPYNKHTSFAITACLSAACLSFTLIDASAQRKGPKGPNGHNGRGKGGPAAGAHINGFNVAEFGVIRDKIAAHSRLTLGGAAYYSKENHELRREHVKTYALIHNSLVEDRIDEKLGRKAVDELLTIGESAVDLQESDGSLSAENTEKISGEIHTLRQRIQKARESKVNPDTLTPKLNERQAKMEELYRFAVESKTASKGQASTLRRHLDSLEKKEDAAKKDGKLSDREHEKLIEETIDVWKAFVKVLKA